MLNNHFALLPITAETNKITTDTRLGMLLIC